VHALADLPAEVEQHLGPGLLERVEVAVEGPHLGTVEVVLALLEFHPVDLEPDASDLRLQREDAFDVDFPVGVVVAEARGALEQAPRDDVHADSEVVLLHDLIECDGDRPLLCGRGVVGGGGRDGAERGGGHRPGYHGGGRCDRSADSSFHGGISYLRRWSAVASGSGPSMATPGSATTNI
jgi:hypothetical protein